MGIMVYFLFWANAGLISSTISFTILRNARTPATLNPKPLNGNPGTKPGAATDSEHKSFGVLGFMA